MGILFFAGGAEFKGKMEAADRVLLASAERKQGPIIIIPTAAAAENNAEGAGRNALKWFRKLGAQRIVSLPIVDKESADDPVLSNQLNRASLVYILGGHPGFLEKTLRASRCLEALWAAYRNGAVLAGSSAGAMVLCGQYVDPWAQKIKKGFGFQKGMIVIPHHDTSGSSWPRMYSEKAPASRWIGIDEQTGMIGRAEQNLWSVYGRGGVTVYDPGGSKRHKAGTTFKL